MKFPAPEGIRAHIHPDLFPYGNIEDGTIDQIVEAEHWLRSQGCTHARGPLGATTWHAYRAVIETDGRAPFLGEPQFSPVVWEARGYSICANYASALAPNSGQSESAQAHSSKLMDAGWTIDDLQSFGGFEAGLKCFHEISTAAFTKAFAYTPLPLDAFRAMYAPIESIIDPRMVLIAISPSGKPAAFCFSIPDQLNPETKQFIIKTLAVDPEHRRAGIGSWLTAAGHRKAHELGWTAGGIHALMWTDSHSRQISKHAGTIFRRYALYEKAL